MRFPRRAGVTLIAVVIASTLACSDDSAGASVVPARLPFDGVSMPVFLTMDALGNGALVWCNAVPETWWARVSPRGELYSPALVIPGFTASAPKDHRDGGMTFRYFRDGRDLLQQYVPAKGWSELPSPRHDLGKAVFEAGPQGRLIVVSRENDQVAQKERLVAERYDPSTGWSAPEVLEEISGVGLTARHAAVFTDGSAVVTWTHREPRAALAFRRFVPGAGWAELQQAEAAYDDSMDLVSDGQGRALLLSYVPTTPADNSDQAPSTITSRTFGPGGIGPVQTVATDAMYPGTSVAMGRNGAAVLAWQGKDKIRAHYFSPASGWRQMDVPNSDPAGSPNAPLVGIDGQGCAVVVWGSGTMANIGYNLHVLSARYDPALGWGSSTQLDPDGAPFFGPLTVNDAGNAMLVWASSPSTSQTPRWVGVLP